MADVDLAAIEMNRGNKPVLIAANVEHYQISDFISRGKRALQFAETGKIITLHDLEPTRKPTLAIRIAFPELLKRFPCDHVHSVMLSHFEIQGKGQENRSGRCEHSVGSAIIVSSIRSIMHTR